MIEACILEKPVEIKMKKEEMTWEEEPTGPGDKLNVLDEGKVIMI